MRYPAVSSSETSLDFSTWISCGVPAPSFPFIVFFLLQKVLQAIHQIRHHPNNTVKGSVERIHLKQLGIPIGNRNKSNGRNRNACARPAAEQLLLRLFGRQVGAAGSKAITDLEIGIITVPSGAVIGSPTTALESAICLIFSKVLSIMPSIGCSLIKHRLFLYLEADAPGSEPARSCLSLFKILSASTASPRAMESAENARIRRTARPSIRVSPPEKSGCTSSV